MTIEISTRFLSKKDAAWSHPRFIVYHAPYITIDQHGYGRMDISTPAQGLATYKVASCLAIVFHSPTTERTVLTHSPNFLQMNTFVPIVDWVTGGKGEVTRNDLPAWFEGAGAKPCVMEAVVLRGFLYGTPLGATYRHDSWMNDFREFLSLSTLARNIQLNIVDEPRLLTNGAVLVDKTTARITYMEADASIRPRNTVIALQNPNIPESESYSVAQKHQDLFVGAILGARITPECAPISLQYDVSRYCLPLALTDEGRQLLRSKKEGEPVERQSSIIRAFGESEDWISRPKGHAVLNIIFTNLLAVGPPCERCNRIGSLKCSGCKGAWYCGEVHQREDWKAHKGWCKSHRFTSSSE